MDGTAILLTVWLLPVGLYLATELLFWLLLRPDERHPEQYKAELVTCVVLWPVVLLVVIMFMLQMYVTNRMRRK